MRNLSIVSVLQLGKLETEIVERKGTRHPVYSLILAIS